MDWTNVLGVCAVVVTGGLGIVGLVAVGVVLGMAAHDELARRRWARKFGPRL